MVKYIEVNGRVFVYEKDFDDVKVYPPEEVEPYWEIILLKDKKEVGGIKATGNVAVIYE